MYKNGINFQLPGGLFQSGRIALGSLFIIGCGPGGGPRGGIPCIWCGGPWNCWKLNNNKKLK